MNFRLIELRQSDRGRVFATFEVVGEGRTVSATYTISEGGVTPDSHVYRDFDGSAAELRGLNYVIREFAKACWPDSRFGR